MLAWILAKAVKIKIYCKCLATDCELPRVLGSWVWLRLKMSVPVRLGSFATGHRGNLGRWYIRGLWNFGPVAGIHAHTGVVTMGHSNAPSGQSLMAGILTCAKWCGHERTSVTRRREGFANLKKIPKLAFLKMRDMPYVWFRDSTDWCILRLESPIASVPGLTLL